MKSLTFTAGTCIHAHHFNVISHVLSNLNFNLSRTLVLLQTTLHEHTTNSKSLPSNILELSHTSQRLQFISHNV